MSDEKAHQVRASVIIPTYNERECIYSFLEECVRNPAHSEYEFIVVDDASPDGTGRLISREFGDTEQIHLVSPEERQGRATAIQTGLRYADGELVAIMDGDNQHPPAKLSELLDAVEQPDRKLVIGSRYVDGGRDERSFSRRVVSRIAILILKIVFPGLRAISDPVSGFFAGDTEFVEQRATASGGSKVLMGILVRGEQSNVDEIPYQFRKRTCGESDFSARTILEFIKKVIFLRTRGQGRG